MSCAPAPQQGRQAATLIETAMIPSEFEVHIRVVLDLSDVAASLYALGNRAKAEAAHVEAELSYTRLLTCVARLDNGQAGWSQAVQHQIQDALRQITQPDSAIPNDDTAAPSPTGEVVMFCTATSR